MLKKTNFLTMGIFTFALFYLQVGIKAVVYAAAFESFSYIDEHNPQNDDGGYSNRFDCASYVSQNNAVNCKKMAEAKCTQPEYCAYEVKPGQCKQFTTQGNSFSYCDWECPRRTPRPRSQQQMKDSNYDSEQKFRDGATVQSQKRYLIQGNLFYQECQNRLKSRQGIADGYFDLKCERDERYYGKYKLTGSYSSTSSEKFIDTKQKTIYRHSDKYIRKGVPTERETE